MRPRLGTPTCRRLHNAPPTLPLHRPPSSPLARRRSRWRSSKCGALKGDGRAASGARGVGEHAAKENARLSAQLVEQQHEKLAAKASARLRCRRAPPTRRGVSQGERTLWRGLSPLPWVCPHPCSHALTPLPPALLDLVLPSPRRYMYRSSSGLSTSRSAIRSPRWPQPSRPTPRRWLPANPSPVCLPQGGRRLLRYWPAVSGRGSWVIPKCGGSSCKSYLEKGFKAHRSAIGFFHGPVIRTTCSFNMRFKSKHEGVAGGRWSNSCKQQT